METCPKCGKTLAGGEAECPYCGVIIKKYLDAQKRAREKQAAELAARRKIEADKKTKDTTTAHGEKEAVTKPIPARSISPPKIRLDCAACKGEQSMFPTKVPRFPALIRLIGYIITIPSVIGIAFAGLLVIISITTMARESARGLPEAAMAGAAIGTGISITLALVIAAVSLVGGLIGWLLIMKKKVFLCEVCGFIMDRA